MGFYDKKGVFFLIFFFWISWDQMKFANWNLHPFRNYQLTSNLTLPIYLALWEIIDPISRGGRWSERRYGWFPPVFTSQHYRPSFLLPKQLRWRECGSNRGKGGGGRDISSNIADIFENFWSSTHSDLIRHPFHCRYHFKPAGFFLFILASEVSIYVFCHATTTTTYTYLDAFCLPFFYGYEQSWT